MHLRSLRMVGEISDFEWTSETRPLAPYDFRVYANGIWRKWEVKTTSGPFNREYYLSQGELREMAHGEEPYRVARVYQASRDGGRMRVSCDLNSFGGSVVNALMGLPTGVTPNGVTISPYTSLFFEEVPLTVPAVQQE